MKLEFCGGPVDGIHDHPRWLRRLGTPRPVLKQRKLGGFHTDHYVVDAPGTIDAAPGTVRYRQEYNETAEGWGQEQLLQVNTDLWWITTQTRWGKQYYSPSLFRVGHLAIAVLR